MKIGHLRINIAAAAMAISQPASAAADGLCRLIDGRGQKALLEFGKYVANGESAVSGLPWGLRNAVRRDPGRTCRRYPNDTVVDYQVGEVHGGLSVKN